MILLAAAAPRLVRTEAFSRSAVPRGALAHNTQVSVHLKDWRRERRGRAVNTAIFAVIAEVCFGEGFRMPASGDLSARTGPASESPPGRNPRGPHGRLLLWGFYGAAVRVGDALAA